MEKHLNEFLSKYIDLERSQKDPQFNFDSPEACDLCGTPFSTQEYLIDGEVNDTPQIPVENGMGIGQWAYMCPECFQARGIAIRWGRGQLYQKTLENDWLLVGGFPPDES